MSEGEGPVRASLRELPDGLVAYRSTPEFTEETVPAGLLARHSTKPGVWGRIVVTRGALEYHVDAPYDALVVVEPDAPAIIPPEVEHRVAPRGRVAFRVEFWRRACD